MVRTRTEIAGAYLQIDANQQTTHDTLVKGPQSAQSSVIVPHSEGREAVHVSRKLGSRPLGRARRILLTGGSRGIGLAAARALAKSGNQLKRHHVHCAGSYLRVGRRLAAWAPGFMQRKLQQSVRHLL